MDLKAKSIFLVGSGAVAGSARVLGSYGQTRRCKDAKWPVPKIRYKRSVVAA